MDVKPSSGHVAPTAPARIIEALRLDGPGGRGPLEGPSGTDADARKPRKVIGVGLGSFPAKTPETLAAPLPAVKQWCPDLDNRSGAVMTTLWCPEAERTQTTATVKTVPGLGSPFGAAAWIPEQQTPSLPPRHQSRTAEAMHRRGISPGRDRDSPQARISITVQSAEAIHATRPFFSDEGEGPNMQHDRRNDDVFEAATHGGQEILTASTKSKSPNSEDDTWVDSAGRNPRLLSVSLTPASGAGINAQAIHTHIDSKSLNEEANGHVASQAAQKILHCGRGGMGRRRETANCNGRHAKYQVQRSHNCSLCFLSGNQQNAIEFVFAERSPHNTRIQLPEETELNVKAARVEFVLPDGSHLWLWSVRPQTISDIRHAISQVANIHNKVAEMPAANSLQKSNSGHETCDVQLGFVPSGEFARVDDADRGNEKMLMGPASSASPGAQRNKPFVPALRLEQLPPPEPVSRALQRATPHTSSCSESESAQPESCSRDRGERMVHHTYQDEGYPSGGLQGYREVMPATTAPNLPQLHSGKGRSLMPFAAQERTDWRPAPEATNPRAAISISTPAPQRLLEAQAYRQVINVGPSQPEMRQAVAGRRYRSHLLQRIDPASTLNVAFSNGKTLGVAQDGYICSPREMDQILSQKGDTQHEDAIRNAMVLM